jgi:hypothetical protein
MLNRLNSVSVAAELPQFFTATLPDDVFNDSVSEFAKDAKSWMDSFIKRLRRVVPAASGFWRIEWQARKSGLHEGRLFPHFHLLVWGLPLRVVGYRDDVDKESGHVLDRVEIVEAFVPCPDSQLTLEMIDTLSERADLKADLQNGHARSECFTTINGKQVSYVFSGKNKFVRRCNALLDDFLVAENFPDHPCAARAKNMSFADWASLAWYNVVGSHNVDHLKAGVRVERVKTWGGVMSYCAKYMAKEDCGFLADVSFGRSWGIFNREAVPWAKMIDINLDNEVGVRLRRVARHYLERRCGRKIRANYGITLYCDVEKFRRLWEIPPPDPF